MTATGYRTRDDGLPPLRGRAAELEVITDLVSGVARGEGGVLILEGPSGIGKSRLVTELLSRADRSGVRTAVGEAFEDQQTVPFFALLTATVHAAPPIGDADELRHLAPTSDLRFWVAEYLQAAIERAAAHAPLVIALEDLHWADNATLALLRVLTANTLKRPVLWVFSVRSEADATVWDALGGEHPRGTTLLRLGPLPAEAAIDVVQDAVRARAGDSLLQMARRAEGNPFLLHELVAGLDEDGRLTMDAGSVLTSGSELPTRLALHMQRRLTRMSRDGRTVVQVASALPDRFSAELLASMMQRAPASLLAPVNEAVRADLLVEVNDQLKFRHDLLREAARRSLPQSLLRALERQSAAHRLEMGVPCEHVAAQLIRSAQPGDQIAIDALRTAASSVSRGDPDSAAELSTRALDLTSPHDENRATIVAETVVYLNQARRFDDARQLAGRALSTNVSAEDEAGIRLRVGSGTESPQDRVKENERALQLSDLSDVTRTRHRAWLAYHQTINWVHGKDTSAVAEAASAAMSSGDLEAILVCETASAVVDFTEGLFRRAADRMNRLHERGRHSEVTLGHIVAAIQRPAMLIYAGDLSEATAATEAGARTAREQRDGMALPSWAACEGMAYLTAGRLSDARTAIEALGSAEWGIATEVNMNRLLCLAEVAVRIDDPSLLQQAVGEADVLYAEGSPLVRRGGGYVLALAAWHRGDASAAARLLGGEVAFPLTPLYANLIHQLILTARVAAVTADHGLRALVSDCLTLLDREEPPSATAVAVAGVLRGLLGGDAERLSAAAAQLQSLGWPLLAAGALDDAGSEHLRRGRRDEATTALNSAFDIYADHEAVADTRRLAGALRRLGVERRVQPRLRPRTGWDSLTPAELRVVHLIAAGKTNPQIAEQLHISTNTVKTHVRKAFSRLEITSRFELRQLMRPPAE